LDVAQRAVELPLGTDQGVDVFNRQDVVETGADRARHGVQRLTGGIRHQVDVEVGGELRRGRGQGASLPDRPLKYVWGRILWSTLSEPRGGRGIDRVVRGG